MISSPRRNGISSYNLIVTPQSKKEQKITLSQGGHRRNIVKVIIRKPSE